MHCRSINKSLQCDPIKILKVGTAPSNGMMVRKGARGGRIVRIVCYSLCRYTFGLARLPDADRSLWFAAVVIDITCKAESPRTVAEGW